MLYSGQRCSSCRSQDRESESLLLQETDCSLLLVSSTPDFLLFVFVLFWAAPLTFLDHSSPDQELNLGPGSESSESYTLDGKGIPTPDF